MPQTYSSEYYQAHKEEKQAYQRQYYKTHKDKARTNQQKYRATHREQYNAYHRAYYAAHREQHAGYVRKAKEKKPCAVGATQGKTQRKSYKVILSDNDSFVKPADLIAQNEPTLCKAYMALFNVYVGMIGSKLEKQMVEALELLGQGLTGIGVLEDE